MKFVIGLLALYMSYIHSCRISMDCKDKEGRSLCFQGDCHADVPCNKDNDCFFYGAADVSHNYPHPKCFANPKASSPPGYGVCMLREYAEGLERIPGDDVTDVEKQAKKDIFDFLRRNV